MDVAFLPARYSLHPTTPRKIDLLVIHAAEVRESMAAAEWLMKYCANNDRVASWHYAVDGDSITQSVVEADVAYHAPGANSNGIGVELAVPGMPSARQWADPYCQSMLTLASWLFAGLCARHKIEPFYVDASGLLEKRRGITTHAQVSLAFKRSDHMDPGPDFPMEAFVAKIKSRLGSGNFDPAPAGR